MREAHLRASIKSLLHKIHFVPEDVSFCVKILLINVNRFNLSYEQFMRPWHNAVHHTALNANRTVCQNRRIYIFCVLPLQVKCGKLILIPAGLRSEIAVLLLESLLSLISS